MRGRRANRSASRDTAAACSAGGAPDGSLLLLRPGPRALTSLRTALNLEMYGKK